MERFHLATASLSLKDIIETPEMLTSSLLALFANFFVASGALCLVALVPAIWLRTKRKVLSNKNTK